MFNTLEEIPVSKVARRRSFDIKYSFKTDRFIVNNGFAKENGLDTRGFRLFIDQEGEAVLVIVPEAEATLYKRTRTTSKTKSPFACSELKQALGIDGSEDVSLNANITTIEGYKCAYLSVVQKEQTVTEEAII